MLDFHIDTTLHNIPCHIVSLDYMDSVGNHHMNVREGLVLTRLDKSGSPIGTDVQTTYENVVKAI